jgi:heme-degrading monooxygenase HmoA
MFVLHVAIRIKAGHTTAAEKAFSGPFMAAISAQEGFKAVQLLRPLESDEYILSIAFENQSLQQRWVATDLHSRVWSEIEGHIDAYSVKTYTAV